MAEAMEIEYLSFDKIQNLKEGFSKETNLDYVYNKLIDIGESFLLDGVMDKDLKDLMMKELDTLREKLIERLVEVIKIYNKLR